ncbi:unnamed protein product [Larinioides sclopetarius]|uniref:Uncharacterized protein n=1 Tax=Larinioides sclopetarius TaxID=280406 RepID=A0AAV2B4S9_9ARAC
MHLRFWVYRRNLSNDPESPFRSNEDLVQKAGCCVSGWLGFIFLGLAVLCLFSSEIDKDRKLFLIFTGLCGIFEIICLLYSCIPWYNRYCRSSNNDEENGYSSISLLSSEENAYEDISGKDGLTSYQACASCSEIPSYQDIPAYQEVPGFLAAPYGTEVGYQPGSACFPPLANYEGVFAHQQIPIYQQDLVEPQLPPYSHAHKQCLIVSQHDINVY